MSNYDDIINLNRPISKHPHQSIESRASQFAPFAALVGYDEQVKETARLTTNKIEIDEGLREILNNKLNYLNDHLDEKEEVSITYFIKDSKKSGGKYITKTGIVKRIDIVNGFIKFTDNDIIYMTDVISITSELFEDIYE
jgi:hypothetical protein